MGRAGRSLDEASTSDAAWHSLRLLLPIGKLVKGVLRRRCQLVSGKKEAALMLAPATVLQPDGEAVEHFIRTRCRQVMRQYPSHRLCPTSALVLRRESYLLSDDEWLQPGEIYILVPWGEGKECDAKIPIPIKHYSTIVARFSPESIDVRVGSVAGSDGYQQSQLRPQEVTSVQTDLKRRRSMPKTAMPRISE